MNLDHYIEELKTLVNVDCGTRTVEGRRNRGWHY